MDIAKNNAACNLLFNLLTALGLAEVDGWRVALTNNGHIAFSRDADGEQATALRLAPGHYRLPHRGAACEASEDWTALPVTPDRLIEAILTDRGIAPEHHGEALAIAAEATDQDEFRFNWRPSERPGFSFHRPARTAAWRIARALAA